MVTHIHHDIKNGSQDSFNSIMRAAARRKGLAEIERFSIQTVFPSAIMVHVYALYQCWSMG